MFVRKAEPEAGPLCISSGLWIKQGFSCYALTIRITTVLVVLCSKISNNDVKIL